MGFVSVPLHRVHLQCSLVAGVFRVGVRPSLPVKGVTFILGNNIAGGQVVPVLEVLEHPDTLQSDVLEQEYPGVFPVWLWKKCRLAERKSEDKEESPGAQARCTSRPLGWP